MMDKEIPIQVRLACKILGEYLKTNTEFKDYIYESIVDHETNVQELFQDLGTKK